MIKRIIALLLAVMLLPCAAAVYAEEREENQAKTHITELFSALDISYEITPEAVTRGEFIITIAGLLNFNLSAGGSAVFDDVDCTTELGAAVWYAEMYEIVAGGDKFEPERAITYAEAAKMAVAALGYQKFAVMKGGYPAGYIAQAAQLGLSSGVKGTGGDTLDESDFFAMMENLIEVDVVEMDGYSGDGAYKFKKESNILEVCHDLTEVKGIVTANEYSYLHDKKHSVKDGYIMINTALYKKNKYDVPLGYYIEGYARETDNADSEIVYLSSEKNEVVRISSKDKPYLSNGRISTTPETGKSKNYNLANNVAVIYNGKAYDGQFFALFPEGDGYAELVKTRSDTDYSVVVINESRFMVAETVDYINKRIFDKNLINNLDLSDDDVKIIVDGGEGIDSISTGDCIEYLESEDKKLYTISVLSKTVSGTVTATDTDRIYIDGECYFTALYFNNAYLKALSSGVQGTFYLSDSGFIVAAAKAFVNEFMYGYVLKVFEDIDDSSVCIKLFSEDGEFHSYTLADRITYDGVGIKGDDRYTRVADLTESLIRYKLDSAGEKLRSINIDQTPAGFEETEDDNYYFRKDTIGDNEKDGVLKRYRFEKNEAVSLYYKSAGYFVPYFTIDGATKIFCVIDKENESDLEKRVYLGGGVGFLPNDTSVTAGSLLAYNVSTAGRADAVVYKTTSHGAPISYESSYGVVSKINTSLDPEGDLAIKIDLYADDKFKTLYIKKEESFLDGITNLKSNGYPFERGDMIRYIADENGYIHDLPILDFDAGAGEVKHNGNANTSLHYTYGKLYDYDDNSFSVIDAKDGKIKCYQGRIGKCGYVPETGIISTVPVGSLVTYLQNPGKCSNILIKCRSSRVEQYIVYE